MPWECRLVVPTGRISQTGARVGDMFFYNEAADPKPDDYESDLWHWARLWAAGKVLSEHYWQHNSHRLPLLVWLPGLELFCVDGMTMNKGRRSGGWQVTGTAPLITVAPSINCVGRYHGHLQAGVITDDCEGRRYGADGRLLI
jgi:hypothetical protein